MQREQVTLCTDDLMRKTYQRIHKTVTRANKKSSKASWNEIKMRKWSFSLFMCKEQSETEIRKVFPFEIAGEVAQQLSCSS